MLRDLLPYPIVETMVEANSKYKYGLHQREATNSHLFPEVKPFWKELIIEWVTIRADSNHASLGGTPLCDLNRDVRPDRVWFSGCFVLNGVSISTLSVLIRVSLHDLMA